MMQVIEVTNPTLAKEFIDCNVLINKTTPNYIRPLDNDINEVFDPKKNKTFRNGEIIRWIVKDENDKLIGRIAAFTNTKYKNKGDQCKVGGIGFFDAINKQEVANLLLDTAKKWLIAKGMQAMDGPINFGERDKFWGLVVEGFNEPLYGMNFNPAYYQQLFENYGFQPFYYQLCFGVDPQLPLSKKIWERYNNIVKDNNFTTQFASKKNLNKYAADFTTVYNAAWAGHGGLKQMKVEQARLLFKKMKVFMDEKILVFAYYKDEPIGIFLNIPDLNQHFKHFNGKLGLLQKLQFLYRIKFKPSPNFCGLVFGVAPQYHSIGVDALMIEALRKELQEGNSRHYKKYEMQWIGDFNPKMVNIASTLGDTFISRKLCTYRYMIDSSIAFERHPIV
jgi:hypothetical protein